MTVSGLEGIAGIVSEQELAQSGDFLAALQMTDGHIPWFPGGHCDPWNHVESAMALTVVGKWDAARAAYRWLATTQLGDGSWFNYYQGGNVKDARLDNNVCAYIATGIYHYWLSTGDLDFVTELWPTVQRAITYVLRWQKPDGTIEWSHDAAGKRERYALLTGSSSIFHALRCAGALAEVLSIDKTPWESATSRLGHAVARHPEHFAEKNEFAMDWYYPVLGGAVRGADAMARIDAGWQDFVMNEHGVRCVSHAEWVTAAETAECVLTLAAMGLRDKATTLFSDIAKHRTGTGGYFTGIAYPQCQTFPGNEMTSYTVAAILLASDALTQSTPGSVLFSHDHFAPLDVACDSTCGN
jgi:hypothetical protein